MAASTVDESLEQRRARLWQEFIASGRQLLQRNRFARANRGLVYFVMNSKFSLLPKDKELRHDLFQEGMLGMLRAIELYDETRGAFSTYATGWIFQHMDRYLKNNQEIIRRPINRQTVELYLHRAEQLFVAEHQRSPSNDTELAEFLGCEPFQVRSVRLLCRKLSVTSLELPVNEDRDSFLKNLLQDDGANTEAEALGGLMEPVYCGVPVSQLREALKLLPERSRDIVLRYAGGLTLEEVGLRHSLTRERIRQLIAASIRRLRGFFGVDPERPIEFPGKIDWGYQSLKRVVTQKSFVALVRERWIAHRSHRVTAVEFRVLEVLWPRLCFDRVHTIDPHRLADYCNLRSLEVYVALASMTEKTVLERDGRGAYRRRCTQVLVETDGLRRLVKLKELVGDHLLEPLPEGIITPIDTLATIGTPLSHISTPNGENGKRAVTPQGFRCQSAVPSPVLTVSNLDREIARLEGLREQIDRRLETLRETRSQLINPPKPSIAG